MTRDRSAHDHAPIRPGSFVRLKPAILVDSKPIGVSGANMNPLALGALLHDGLRLKTQPREKDLNLQHPGSEPGVLPIELSLSWHRRPADGLTDHGRDAHAT